MDEREFLDLMYQMWMKTTGAEDHYWMYERDDLYPLEEYQNLFAIDKEQQRKHLAAFVRDEDADFITAIHGSFPDIYRRCLEAFDEADRLDLERDEQENRIAELEFEVMDLQKEADVRDADLEEFGSEIKELRAEISKLKDELEFSRAEGGYYQTKWMEDR